MACQYCDAIGIKLKQKLGRCKACMAQLTLLTAITWPLWALLYSETPTHVESIAMLFFACAFSALLVLHCIFWCYYRLSGNS